VTDKDKNEYVIHTGETISFQPYQGRAFVNAGNKPAVMLVVINYPNEE
jgi:quercetin dioxygenase-like cupin family protein